MNKEKCEYSAYQKVSLVNATTCAPGALISCLCIELALIDTINDKALPDYSKIFEGLEHGFKYE